jgi:adenine/guanine phosphoribosyltransferase-like PRPP-binding protein
MLQRATAPMVPKATKPAGMLDEAEALCREKNWTHVSLVAASGNWIHIRRRGDVRVTGWPVTHKKFLEKGVYLLGEEGMIRYLTPDKAVAAGREGGGATLDDELRDKMKTHGKVYLPDWTAASYAEVSDLVTDRSHFMLIMAGDPSEMQDGLGPGEAGPGALRAPLPALRALIEGLPSQPVGGTGQYQMTINWADVGGSLGNQALAAMQKVKYTWELRKVTEDDVTAAIAKANVPADADPNAVIDPWAAFRHDTARRVEEVKRHPDQYWQDLVKGWHESRYGDVISNAMNLQLLGVETLANIGGTALDAWVTVSADGRSASIPWKEEGVYVLRCDAKLDPDTERRNDTRWRPDSIAVRVIRIKTTEALSEEGFQKEQKDEEQLTDAERFWQTAASSAEEGSPLAKMRAEAEQKGEEHWKATRGNVVAALELAIAAMKKKVDDRRATSPFIKAGLYDSVLAQLESDRDKIVSRRDLAVKREGWMRAGNPQRDLFRVPAYYASKVTGESYSLLLEVDEPKAETDGSYTCELQDVTSEGGYYHGKGASREAAISDALAQVAATLPDGVMNVRIPDPTQTAGPARTFPTTLRGEQVTKQRLQELATILGILALAAGGQVGLIGAIAGGAAAAISLAERYRSGTLKPDFETAMDIVAVLQAFAGSASAVLGPLQKLEDGQRFLIRIAKVGGAVGGAAGKFDVAVLSPGSMILGDLSVMNQLMEIDKLEHTPLDQGGITGRQASRRRADLVANNIALGHLSLLGHLTEQTERNESQRPEEKPPPIEPRRETPVEQVTRTGKLAPHQADGVIKGTGGWKTRLKALVGGLPEGNRPAAEQTLATARKAALDAEIRGAGKRHGVEPYDVGTPGFGSDIDVTIVPSDRAAGFTGKPRSTADQIRAAALGAQEVINGLQRKFGGDPETTLDVAVHAWIGEDIAPAREGVAERMGGADLELEVGLAELRRGSGPEEMAEIVKRMTDRLPADAAPEARARLERALKASEEFKNRMDGELARVKELMTNQAPGLPPEVIEKRARDRLLLEKRMQLADLFDQAPLDWGKIERLQAEIRWFAPGAYAGSAAFQTTVRHGQARKDPANVAGSFAERASENRSAGERQSEVVGAIASHLAMLKGHLTDSSAPMKEALKYGGRALEQVESSGARPPDGLIPELLREFKQSRWGEADPGAVTRLAAEFADRSGLGDYVKRNAQGEIVELVHPLPWVMVDRITSWMMDQLAAQTVKATTMEEHAFEPPPTDRALLKDIAEVLNKKGATKAEREQVIYALRTPHEAKRGALEGYIPQSMLNENRQAIVALRDQLTSSSPDAIVGMERGGALLADIVAAGHPDLAGKIRKMPVIKAEPPAPGKQAKSKFAPEMAAQFEALVANGAKKIAIIDYYMGGTTASSLSKLLRDHFSDPKFAGVTIEVRWIRESLGFADSGGVLGDLRGTPDPGQKGAGMYSQTAIDVKLVIGDDMESALTSDPSRPLRVFDDNGNVVQTLTTSPDRTTRDLVIELLNQPAARPGTPAGG